MPDTQTVWQYMEDVADECRDRAGEIHCTWLAEMADDEFAFSQPPGYEIPDWLFELAYDVYVALGG